MVVYEAARAIVNIRNVTARQVAPAVSVLQLFLASPRPVLRFAAVRTLNKVSISHPNAVKTCVLDMENLITDSNRSVATLAITTLLKVWHTPPCHYGNALTRSPFPIVDWQRVVSRSPHEANLIVHFGNLRRVQDSGGGSHPGAVPQIPAEIPRPHEVSLGRAARRGRGGGLMMADS